MRGMMQHHDLTIASLLTHAAENHRHSRIDSVGADGAVRRFAWPDVAARAARLAHALRRLGAAPGDRVGTLAWNDHRHLELYFAVSGIGCVCHTINPRLFQDQVAYIVAHAGDRWLFVDPGLIGVVEAAADAIVGTVAGIVVLGETVPETPLAGRVPLIAYEALLAPEPETIDWPRLDENAAAALCYTSGTTGEPKGVLYSHRSTVLHAWSIALPDMFCFRAVDVLMPVVPMFHVQAWGIPYGAALAGASLALPGPRLDGASLHRLIEGSGVTVTAGVPTVWLGLMEHLAAGGGTLPAGLRIISGGAALPRVVIETLEKRHGARVEHAWGMTEMSPVGAHNAAKPENAGASDAERIDRQRKQGRPPYGVAMRIVGDDGAALPRDGTAFGELQVRGPWVADAYFGDGDDDPAFTGDGWFRTGDVATLDESGYMHIVDRAKDVIKSGGEWISSIRLENIAVGHPRLREAAVIPARHPKWGERPLLVAVPTDGPPPSRADVLAIYDGQVPKWMIPDDVVLVGSLPHTATGKLMKRALRERHGGHYLGRPHGETE